MNNLLEKLNCPLFLGDQGRFFTDYVNSKDINFRIMKQNNITDSNEYRLHLQNNASYYILREQDRLSKHSCDDNELTHIDGTKFTQEYMNSLKY
jgi:hypothetical protein